MMELEFDNAQHLRNDTSFDDILHYDRSRDLFDYLLLSISGSTILLQMFIIWLILCRTPENMREYRLYLCGMSFSDLLFNFAMGFLIEPHLWAPDSLGAHVMGLAQFFGQNGGRIAYSVAAFALTSQILFLMFSTIFRFASVKHMDHTALHLYLRKLSFRVTMVAGVMAMALGVAYVSFLTIYDRQSLLGWHFSLWPIPANWSTDYLNELSTPLNQTGDAGQPVFNQPALLEAISVFAMNPSNNFQRARVRYSIRTKSYTNEMKHMVNAIQLGYPIVYFNFLNDWLFYMCFIYFCCILCVEITCLGASLSVIRYLRRHRHCFTAQTYKMQMQLIILLIIQIVEPMLLVFMPITYVLFSLLVLNANKYVQEPNNTCQVSISALNLQSRQFAQAIVIALVIYSAVNTLLILCFVGPYRREFCAVLKRPFLPVLRRLFGRQYGVVQPIGQQQPQGIITTIRHPPTSV